MIPVSQLLLADTDHIAIGVAAIFCVEEEVSHSVSPPPHQLYGTPLDGCQKDVVAVIHGHV